MPMLHYSYDLVLYMQVLNPSARALRVATLYGWSKSCDCCEHKHLSINYLNAEVTLSG